MFFASLIILLVTFIFAKLLYGGDKKVKEFARRVPGPPLYPIIGNLPMFLGSKISFSEIMQSNYDKYGERFRFVVGNNAVMVTSNIKDVEAVVASTSTKSDVYNLLKYFLGTSLVLNAARFDYLAGSDARRLTKGRQMAWRYLFNFDQTSTEQAKKKRRVIVPTFHASVLDSYFPALEDALKRLTNILDKSNGELVDITDIVERFTIDILTETSMGVRINALENLNSEYIKAFKSILECYDSKWTNVLSHIDFIYKRTKLWKTEKVAADLISEFCEKIIAERRNAVKSGGVLSEGKQVPFLDALLTYKDQNGRTLNNEDIKNEVNTIMIAGHDTSYSTFSNLAHVISTNPELEERLFKEQIEIMGNDKTRAPSLEDTNKMKYLDMALKEILRLYTTIPTIGRIATKEFELADGVIVPEGTNIFLNLFNMGRNEKVFPDPLKFDPERWTPENTAKRSIYSSIPFSIGPRNCIGMSFAMWELKSLFSQILRNYKLVPSEKKFELTYSLILKPKEGLQLKFVKRV